MQIKDFRNLFTDTVVTTTHFLKKCIKVPKVHIRQLFEDPTAGVSEAEAVKIIERQGRNVFKRGSMNFEDYNYDFYNKFILIDPHKALDDGYDNTDNEGQSVKEKSISIMLEENQNKYTEEEGKSVTLTEKHLDLKVTDTYQHDTMDVNTQAEKNQQVEEELKKKKLEKEKELEEKKELDERQIMLLEQDKKDNEEEKDEENESQENGEENGEDDIEYNVYYNREQIKQTFREQKKDIFEDIIQARREVLEF